MEQVQLPITHVKIFQQVGIGVRVDPKFLTKEQLAVDPSSISPKLLMMNRWQKTVVVVGC